MIPDRFRVCLGRVLKHEGRFANHPDDPGGATMKGVTQRVYDDWRKRRALPTRSVRHITDDELAAIYRAGYWDAVRADKLPLGVDYVTFDAAVNSGPRRAVKWLQEAAGVRTDGVVGPVTLQTVRVHEAAWLIERSCDIRMAFLRRLKHWRTFGRGWTRRVTEAEDAALADLAPPRASEGAVEPRPAPAAPVDAPAPQPRPLGLWARLRHWWRCLR